MLKNLRGKISHNAIQKYQASISINFQIIYNIIVYNLYILKFKKRQEIWTRGYSIIQCLYTYNF